MVQAFIGSKREGAPRSSGPENGSPAPAVIGQECAKFLRIQVEPRIDSIRPEPIKAWGFFIFPLAKKAKKEQER